jgi:hypothetical protein
MKKYDTKEGALYDTRMVFYWEGVHPAYIRECDAMETPHHELQVKINHYFIEACTPEIESGEIIQRGRELIEEIKPIQKEYDRLIVLGYEVIHRNNKSNE